MYSAKETVSLLHTSASQLVLAKDLSETPQKIKRPKILRIRFLMQVGGLLRCPYAHTADLITNAERLIGRRYDDKDVQRDIKHYPFKVTGKGDKPNVQIKVGDETRTFSPEEISAMILGKMKETAEAYLGKKVTNAVVTVPA